MLLGVKHYSSGLIRFIVLCVHGHRGEQGYIEKCVLPAWCFAWGTLDWHKLYYGGAGTSVFKEGSSHLGTALVLIS